MQLGDELVDFSVQMFFAVCETKIRQPPSGSSCKMSHSRGIKMRTQQTILNLKFRKQTLK